MINVIIPIIVLLAIVLVKKIPIIGGNINVALLVTGALTLILGGLVNPGEWIAAWVDGLDRLAWIIALSIMGSIFAEISLRLGTIDTIIGMLTAKFGKRPRAMTFCVLLALTLAGSLLGDAIAAATVIGMLTVGVFVSMNIAFEKISAMIVMGACIGSIMPPMTQGLALSSSLVGAEVDPVINIGYITTSIIFLLVAFYSCFFLVKKDNLPGSNKAVDVPVSTKTASEIFKEGWKSLIPVAILIIIILLRTLPIPYISVDLGVEILKSINFIKIGEDQVISLYDFISNISILKGLSNGIVLSILCAILASFSFKTVSMNAGDILETAFAKVKTTVGLQVCCAFMLGSFYAAGAIEQVTTFATGLDNNVLIIGGALAMILIGMLTGSQSTAQNVVFSFLGPALVASGVTPVFAAIAGANLASAGQGMPPADLTTFVVVGIISAQYGKKVDPLKSMMYSIPMCIFMGVVGIIFCYL